METLDAATLQELHDNLIRRSMLTNENKVHFVRDMMHLTSGAIDPRDIAPYWSRQQQKLSVVSSLTHMFQELAEDADNAQLLLRIAVNAAGALTLAPLPEIESWPNSSYSPECPVCEGEISSPSDLRVVYLSDLAFDSLYEDDEKTVSTSYGSDTIDISAVYMHTTHRAGVQPCLISPASFDWDFEG